MINPVPWRCMASGTLDDLDGIRYHHFFVRGNTLVCIPGSRNQNVAPLGVTTWQISEIVQGMQQAWAEHILDGTAFDMIDSVLQATFAGVYVDCEYMCPGIIRPSISVQLKAMFTELAESATWTWEGWLSLEADMNTQGIAHGYASHLAHDDDEFQAHIAANITIVEPDRFASELSDLGFSFVVDVNGVHEFSFDDVTSELSI